MRAPREGWSLFPVRIRYPVNESWGSLSDCQLVRLNWVERLSFRHTLAVDHLDQLVRTTWLWAETNSEGFRNTALHRTADLRKDILIKLTLPENFRPYDGRRGRTYIRRPYAWHRSGKP